MGVASHTWGSRHLPSILTTHINMADAEQQVVEEVAPEAAAEKPEEVTAVAAEPEASTEASDPPAEAVAAVKISEEAAAAEGEGEPAPAAVVEGEEAVASPPALQLWWKEKRQSRVRQLQLQKLLLKE